MNIGEPESNITFGGTFLFDIPFQGICTKSDHKRLLGGTECSTGGSCGFDCSLIRCRQAAPSAERIEGQICTSCFGQTRNDKAITDRATFSISIIPTTGCYLEAPLGGWGFGSTYIKIWSVNGIAYPRSRSVLSIYWSFCRVFLLPLSVNDKETAKIKHHKLEVKERRHLQLHFQKCSS